ncbi:Anaphase-promoting complex subunit 2 [Leucoagaricus sp. SymC.cos]|nr:Anaphase-promoting complex subunit 2 [Leucoagaricus sp. SymC.cos]
MASDALRHQVAAKWQESFARLNRSEQGISGLISFGSAWNTALGVLHPRRLDEPKDAVDMNAIRTAFTIINAGRRLPFLLETFLEELKQQYYLVEADVRGYMTQYEAEEDPRIIELLVLRLVEWFKHWAPLPELGTTIYSAYTLSFQTHLFSIVPPSFARGFKALVASTLAASASAEKSSGEYLPETDNPNAPIWQAFETLGLIDRYETIIATVGYEFIEQHVLETCTGEWSRPLLGELRDWMSDKVVPWMLLIYARGATNAEEARAMLQGVGSRFDFHINKTLCDLRTREIWDIIIDFPDSTGALQDLRDCLQRVDQRSSLVRALRQANRKRLLHPGADTKLILTQYVATIKCLRLIDPPGVLLFKVADPIRRYLRERPDTIRCIVANLVGDDSDSPDSLLDDTLDPHVNPATLVDDYSDPNWDPEPIDAGPEFRTNKPSDVLSTLVSIYDSQDLFVKELQVLLAQRLLSIPISGDGKDNSETIERIEKERRNIEILKLRFGEAALGVCEVMLRDMTDSRRIDLHIQAQLDQTTAPSVVPSQDTSPAPSSSSMNIVHPTIISHHFWPSLSSSTTSSSHPPHSSTTPSSSSTLSTLTMPGQFTSLQQSYSSQFMRFKPDKTLRFISHLGSVTLHLELQDREVEVTVPPLEAALIELFSDGRKGVWTLDELREGVGGVDKGSVLKALLTWIDLGVIRECEGREGLFEVVEVKEEGKEDELFCLVLTLADVCLLFNMIAVAAQAHVQETAIPSPQSAQQQQAEQMRMYWKFIEGMLTNLGGLPTDRIQSMLRFAPGYDQTQEQLAVFLDAARREGVVVFRDGVWKLNK